MPVVEVAHTGITYWLLPCRLSTGATLSDTVTVNVSLLVLPAASRMVIVSVVVPTDSCASIR